MSDNINLQSATKQWVDSVLQYYSRSPNRSDLTQVFARGFFAGWSEREVAQFVDRLNKNNIDFPPWDKK